MDTGTKIRSIVLIIALINQALVTFGFDPIPGDENQWYEIVSTAFTVVSAIVSWFKNNYVTAKGKQQKEVLEKNGLTNAR